jgi:hypothetical protein
MQGITNLDLGRSFLTNEKIGSIESRKKLINEVNLADTDNGFYEKLNYDCLGERANKAVQLTTLDILANIALQQQITAEQISKLYSYKCLNDDKFKNHCEIQ